MDSLRTPEHDWAVERLLAFAAGLLPEQETLRLQSHLDGCADCRARLEPLKAASAADAGHLPASLVATWPRSSRLLAGVARDLVGAHLERCEPCRASLRFAGHEPSLPREGAVPTPRRARPVVNIRRAGWIVGFAGAAAAAAWLLLARPVPLPSDSRTSATMGPLSGRAAPSISVEPGQDPRAPDAIDLFEGAPGAPAVTAAVVVERSSLAGGLVLRLPASLRTLRASEPARVVELSISGAGGPGFRSDYPLGTLGDAVRLRMDVPAGETEFVLRLTLAARGAGAPARAWSYPLRVS